jgi:diguanylate cyclase (GGDEF)-like protein/PAS domain S-box-containing protein
MPEPPSIRQRLSLAEPAGNPLLAELDEARRGLRQLQAQAHLLQAMLDCVLAVDGEQLWEWDEDSDTVLFHRPDGEVAGETSERLRNLLDDAHADDQTALREAWQRVRRRERERIDHTFRRAIGMQWRWVRLRGRRIGPADGPLRLVGTLADVSELRRGEELRQLRAQAWDASDDLLALLDARGQVIEVNPGGQRLLGRNDSELRDRRLPGFLRETDLALAQARRDGSWRADTVLQGAGGREIQVQARVVPCGGRLGGAEVFLLAARDVTAERASAQVLDRLAHVDSLTGLPNRLALQGQLQRRLDGPASSSLAVLFVNVDGFKSVNDALGHEFGDALLQEVGRRLVMIAGPQGLVGRWGGDEFIVAVASRQPQAEGQRVAERILQQLRRETTVGGHQLSASVSIGIALAPEHARTADMLVRYADTAMLAAKRLHRGGWALFRREYDDDGLRRLTLINLLRQDAERGGFHFVAQPKVDGQGLAVGFELLIRWSPGELGAVSPAQFIPLAEEIGVIAQLGREAMLAATRLIRGLFDAGCRLPVAVNLSSRQLIDPVLEQALVESCAIEGIDPDWLEVEITESALLDNVDTAKQKLGSLRARGFRIALDDFGTGYSSLSYLRDLPFDKVKIDKSFVTAMRDGPRAIALLRGIRNLCTSLGMKTVAEGVETRAEFETLQSIGVDEFQGYLFARPLTTDKAIAFARERR